ncbi:hypothetical protein B2J88_48520 [Rhodococcus sp. SRB_17]|uniref:LysR family transcriptional regulator n=1 Tax=Acidovorax sp. SRB_24 TaxID=1962700 RepID=UPI00145C5E4E|nr:LysR family transcriptional regulator [Acidovorax sp. SRB_24]NMM78875.1 hypothetical protein [Acidovorax sp. SRB_24]NMM92023.1 hypothetical protein [Rhodococcus sp. SRB_17]
MELRWLYDFLVVAETKNFTKAAELRHASQAALSRRIQQLEAWMGVRLIDRAVYPSCLTAHGERFVAQATEMLRLANESRDEATKGLQASSNSIRIALPLTVATHLLPGWWRAWFADQLAPGCQALPTNLHDAVMALVSDSADLLLCYYSPMLPIQLELDHFERKVLVRDTLRPYASPLFLKTLTTSADVVLKSGGAHQLAYTDGTYLGQLVRRVSEAHKLPPPQAPVFRSDMADVLCQMAMEGAGIAWLPGCAAAKAVSRGELVPFGGERMALEIFYAAYRNVDNRNPALHHIWQALTGLPFG